MTDKMLMAAFICLMGSAVLQAEEQAENTFQS